MGYAISWVAVQGKDPQQILDDFDLARSGKFEEIPEAPITSALLPNGWFLIFANEFNSPLVSMSALEALSTGGQLVSCQVEEHVMVSSAASYINGAFFWCVEHDAQKSLYHMESRGSVPHQFNKIHEVSRKEQDEAGGEKADTDYIHDAPIVLAQAITSFRHDEEIPNAPLEPFEVLVPKDSRDRVSAVASPKPWWKLW